MKNIRNYVIAALISFTLGLCGTASAATSFTINDPKEITAFNSGYDVEKIVFTLHPDFSLTTEIFPYGVAADTDGDGDPNLSSNPAIIDEVGVGPREFVRIAMECGAVNTGGNCTPNVNFVYANNVLRIIPVNTSLNGQLDPYVTFAVLQDRYVLTITDLAMFKTILGVPNSPVNFGAFSVVLSRADGQVDDLVPDSGTCEYVNLALPPLCDLSLTKTANVSTVGPLAMAIGNENDNDDSSHKQSDSHIDRNNSGDSDDSDSDDSTNLTCGCKGKVSQLTLRYNGTSPTTVQVDRINPFGTTLYPATAILPGDEFTVKGSSFGPNGYKGTLGVGISITKDGANPVQIHTSCSQPVGPGLIAGDFEVVSGNSKKFSKPLCPIVTGVCPTNQQVTYTYTVTNNGDDLTNLLVTDNKMTDPVGGPVNLAKNAAQIFTANACLYETTTNVAKASGKLGNGEVCVSNEPSVTVEMLVNPPPPGGCTGTDSDSDSGLDGNANGDSDDSDADSGDQDCDGDDTSATPPPPPPQYHGCTYDYWEDLKKHKSAWKVYSPDDRFDAIFGIDASGNKGLHKVLKEKDMNGKGAATKDLQRQAAAALLNASNPDVHYFYKPGEVIAIVFDAYNTKNYDNAKNLLKVQNETSCPFTD